MTPCSLRLLLFLDALALTLLAAPPAIGETVVVRGATIHPISGEAIPDGVLVATDGVIDSVGPAVAALPAGARVVEGSGLHLWPGLIDAYASIGLTEIGSVRGTVDVDESGNMNPNARAEVSLNASSSHLPVARANGILLAATFPQGGLVAGTGATIALDGYTNEELVRKAPTGLAIIWPAMLPVPPPEPGKEGPDKEPPPPTWQEDIARLDEMLREARAYAASRGASTTRDADVRWQALVPVIDGKVPLWIQAGRLVEIRAALAFAERNGIPMVLVDGSDGQAGESWRCAEELAARHVPVVLRSNRLPMHEHDPYDTPFTAAAKLREKGVTVVFATWSSWATRTLPQEAARAVAFGLAPADAERALTLDAAKVCGIGERYGSLEPGKSATFILVEGDLLDTRMQVKQAFLDGREVSIDSHHTELWKHWSARPKRQ